jgi:hypothetical protein
MSDSPYEPPQAPSVASVVSAPEKLRRIAAAQRRVLLALLATIVINILSLSLRTMPSGAPAVVVFALLLLVASLVVMIFSMISIYALAKELYSPGIGILCAVLMLIPCVSLIALLIVNQKASAFLQSHGVRVGLLGADLNRI